MTNKIIIFCLGVFAGGFIVLKYPFKADSESELAKAKLKEFYRMEELCGKGNVRDKCKYGYCASELGFTCFHWRKVVYEEEKKGGD